MRLHEICKLKFFKYQGAETLGQNWYKQNKKYFEVLPILFYLGNLYHENVAETTFDGQDALLTQLFSESFSFVQKFYSTDIFFIPTKILLFVVY